MKTTTFLLAAFLANPENKDFFVQFNSKEELKRIFDIIKTEKLSTDIDVDCLLEQIPSYPLYLSFKDGVGTNLMFLTKGKAVPSEILVANTDTQPWQEPIEHSSCNNTTCTCPENKTLKTVELSVDLYEELLIDALGLNPAHVEESLLSLLNEEQKKLEEQQAILNEWHQESTIISQRVAALYELRQLKSKA